jgi:hypothetical protein
VVVAFGNVAFASGQIICQLNQYSKPHPGNTCPYRSIRVAQKILSYTMAFCFMGLMKFALALPAIFVTSQPYLRLEKYVDSVSTS